MTLKLKVIRKGDKVQLRFLVEALMRSNAGPQTGLKDEIDLH